jgi:hypothetical protein
VGLWDEHPEDSNVHRLKIAAWEGGITKEGKTYADLTAPRFFYREVQVCRPFDG